MNTKKQINRRDFLKAAGTVGIGAALGLTSSIKAANSKPNFIFFITDDIGQNDLGCYGNENAKTPNLDKMASEGVVFDNAYLTISSCSPSRCSIITGRYPHNTGAPELHTTLPTDQFCFPQALRKAGYYTALSGKNHMGDVKRAFDKISAGKGPGKEEDWIDIMRSRPADKPFFFWFASTDAHRDWQYNDKAPRFQSDQVTVPPFLYDGPLTRQDLTGYYHEVSRSDYYAGQICKELKRQGVADNTYFVYCSDNGRPFPRCKTRVYDSGVKTPLIVWAPGKLKPERTDSLVSSIDFSATFLDLAGVDKSKTIQGRSFAKILKDPKATTRDYVFSEHNWHVYQAHERMVRYKNWVYVRNAWPERQNLAVESTGHFPAGKELWQMEAEGKLKPYQRDIFQVPRAAEELFDLARDPYQLRNRVDEPDCKQMLDKLRKVMDTWIDQTADTVQTNPTNDRQDAYDKPNPNFKRGTFPGAERNATKINHPGPVSSDT